MIVATIPRKHHMNITDIDPLGTRISPDRAIEMGSITRTFADQTALTVRQEKDFERLLTSAYIAGWEDAMSHVEGMA
jgi:hypothetical protein